MSGAALILHQFRYDQKRFWRDPAGLFYAVAFPLIFLFVYLAVLGGSDETATIGGRTLESANYYLPAIITLSVVSATFVNLAVSLTAARERGTLKRVRGTPLPTRIFLAGRIATSVAVTLLIVALVVAAGWIGYGVEVPTSTLPGALLVLVVGAAAFCCVAFALTIVTPSANFAAGVAFSLALMLYFLSGMFARNDTIPSWARHIADALPVKRLFQSLAIALDPNTTGSGIRVWDLAVLAAWGLAGLLVALRFFRWSPQT